MYIEELSSKTNNKYIKVCLSYDETRDMANGLYEVAKTHPEYNGIYSKVCVLRDMIKHGMVQPQTVEKLYQVANGKEAAEHGKE